MGENRWAILGENPWASFGENHWAILGENPWASFGENHWAPLGETAWAIIVRKMTQHAIYPAVHQNHHLFAGSTRAYRGIGCRHHKD